MQAEPGQGFRPRLAMVLAGHRFQHAILVLIIANAVILGLQTSETIDRQFGDVLLLLDRAIVAVFVVEIALRLVAHGASFFRDPWSVFDFLVVGMSMLPAASHFSVLRALRVLRVLRVVTVAPSMRRVVGALVAAIPGLGSIATVLLLIFYVFAVIGTHLFGDAFPQWFGHIGRSLYTLFQVMTLESWSMGISRPVMEAFPYAWAFFVPFILIATFTMLNLFIAVIVNATQAFAEAEKEQTIAAIDEARDRIEDEVHVQLRGLRSEIAELRALLADGRATRDGSA